MNKLKVLFLLSVILFSVASCEEETTIQGVYSYGINSFTGDLYDFGVVENYLNKKGCLISGKIFKADSDKELDKQAIALFSSNKAKININELALEVRGSVTFTYGLGKADNEDFLKESKYEIVRLTVQ
jgi:hypothetical protein